jgi:hypothetical protein
LRDGIALDSKGSGGVSGASVCRPWCSTARVQRGVGKRSGGSAPPSLPGVSIGLLPIGHRVGWTSRISKDGPPGGRYLPLDPSAAGGGSRGGARVPRGALRKFPARASLRVELRASRET